VTVALEVTTIIVLHRHHCLSLHLYYLLLQMLSCFFTCTIFWRRSKLVVAVSHVLQLMLVTSLLCKPVSKAVGDGKCQLPMSHNHLTSFADN